ncbi:uncharacterized protein EI97DRAFT_500385 [Westerdykella ornata]|uniref:Uncharacterized protein n=1 Tax=Westerdykella ornata TaxID=318751 RepID=A0A6A6JMS2_WESOR|nr:uncharacterized protein EI97DRAFT_500385 [Westerdykella ornata]KAF2277423.1 hypothetical protein EI97DRAFT_500385 [Westerdykella ornata]
MEAITPHPQSMIAHPQQNTLDCNTLPQRKPDMEGQTESKGTAENMSRVKELFQSRHYLRCSLSCQQLLSRTNEQTHPIHKAYLNFYLALSHDTMAREAGMRNRQEQLALAEKHYLAAIHSLTSPEFGDGGSLQSGYSPTLERSNDLLHRRPSDVQSVDSDHSASTAATSTVDSDHEEPGRNSAYHKPLPFSEPKLSVEVTSFLNMVRTHLAGVRQLQQSSGNATQRSCLSRMRPASPAASRPGTRASHHDNDSIDQPRWERKNLVFRPRFDPTSIRKLCDEALQEL